MWQELNFHATYIALVIASYIPGSNTTRAILLVLPVSGSYALSTVAII